MHLLTVSVGQRCWWSPTDFATLALKRRWPPRQPPPPEHREVLIIHSIYTHPENWSMDTNNSHNLKGDNVEPKNHPFGKKSMLVFGGVSPSLDNPGWFFWGGDSQKGWFKYPLLQKCVYTYIQHIYCPTNQGHLHTLEGVIPRCNCYWWCWSFLLDLFFLVAM